MSIADDLLATSQAQVQRKVLAAAPKSYRPGDVKENEDGTSTVTSNPSQEPNPKHDQLLIEHGYDPERDMIVGPINSRSWNVYRPYEYRQLTAPKRDDETREAYDERLDQAWKGKFYYHRFNTVPRPNGETKAGVEELIAVIKSPGGPRKTTRQTWSDDGAYVHGFGDLQIGKYESPLEDLVPRFQENIQQGVDLYASRKGRQEHVHLPYLGDCIEGNQSQGGKNMWRTTLTMTEQVRVLRRLMLYSIQAYAPHCKRLTVVSVPGNHDHAFSRNLTTRSDDSWAVEALVAVDDALKVSSDYQHVEAYIPGPDERTVTLAVGGANITHLHGDQHRRGKHFEWFGKQNFHRQDAGNATITFRGHEHTGQYEEHGHYTALAWPALETRSVWFEEIAGVQGRPGTFALDITKGHIDGLHRIK